MEKLLQKAQEIRMHILDMIYAAKVSHIGSCFSVVGIICSTPSLKSCNADC
jgi:transketolase N-terminal domain/subunit